MLNISSKFTIVSPKNANWLVLNLKKAPRTTGIMAIKNAIDNMSYKPSFEVSINPFKSL